MPYQDPFQIVTTKPCSIPIPPRNTTTKDSDKDDFIADKFFKNVTAPRINTDSYMYDHIKWSHSGMSVIDIDTYSCNILAYMNATGDGMYTSLGNITADNSEFTNTKKRISPASQYSHFYIPPSRRLNGNAGNLIANPVFDKFKLKWKGHELIMYFADCRDGTSTYQLHQQFLVTSDVEVANTLLKTVGMWQNVLHDEVWVFDQGYWQKDAVLYAAVRKSRWEDIILPEQLKEDLLDTVLRFYDSQDVYEKLRVPWKRGLIFYGPPGNGKTVSIKATMKTLLDREESVPTLYVKSFASFGGPEFSISQIFGKARSQAPCYLVFEDLDSMVTEQVRSFFLNAVDGLSENEGILMVGSTNHIERLDPGLAKRPSRFDRKYLFDNPDLKGRTAYCHYWQKKLKDNKDVEFPDKLCPAIAKLMDEFSFAYMQEAFVSTLLKIATERVQTRHDERTGRDVRRRRRNRFSRTDEAWDMVEFEEQIEIIEKDEAGDGDKDDDLNKYVLFREIKVQIENLRKELE